MKPATLDSTTRQPGLDDPLETADRIAPAIEAAAADNDEGRELSPGVFNLLLDAGFYRLCLPKSVGGYELTPERFALVIERIARADGSTAWCLSQAAGCAMSAGYLAPAVAQEIFSSRRAVLAWGAGPKGRAVATAGGYEVTGTWLFASGGRQANWLGAHVPVFEADGSPRMQAPGKQLVRTQIFPATDAKMTDVWHVMGLKGTGSDNYAVEKLFVPEERTFVWEGDPHRSQQGLLFRFPMTLVYAAGFCSVALGLSRAMLDAFIDLARGKKAHNQKDPLRDNPLTHLQIGQAEALWRSAHSYLHASLQEVQQAVLAADQPSLSPEQRMELRLACTFGIHRAKEVADIAWHAAGSTAIFENARFERRFRDLHAVTQQIQARIAHYETVGQFILGLTSEPNAL